MPLIVVFGAEFVSMAGNTGTRGLHGARTMAH